MKVSDSITPYENNQYNDILKWEKKEPSVVEKAMGFVFKPAAWLVNQIVPKKALEGALHLANKGAEFLTDSNDIKRDGNVSEISELKTKSLELSDKLADNVHNWALALAGAEGGATGATGLVGIAVDIPTIITLSLRTIHKIGLCYGFEAKTENDQKLIYAIMSSAAANTIEEKDAALLALKEILIIIQKNTWKKLIEEAAAKRFSLAAAIIGVKQLGKQLGINLTRRKALQAIPFIGAGVGTLVNIAYMQDIAWAARRIFQRMWLVENGKLIPEKRDLKELEEN